MIKNQKGFTLLELVLTIIIISVLAAVAIPHFLSWSKEAERASFEYQRASLSTALNIYSAKELADGQLVTAHNPFDGASVSNYAGAFPDVDGTNCPAGYWAYQSGSASLNGNWVVVAYRPKSTLTQAFSWGGMQWILYTEDVVTDSSGKAIGLKLTEYPPLHKW
jgi:prepilin-type N-terminal cleavage/methylation domain-containing protein